MSIERHRVTIGAMRKARAKNWWLYLLDCKNGRLYTGIAVDVRARFALHLRGKGAKFTRANPPLAILAAQSFANRSEASKAEYVLKQLSRAQKLEWAKQNAALTTRHPDVPGGFPLVKSRAPSS